MTQAQHINTTPFPIQRIIERIWHDQAVRWSLLLFTISRIGVGLAAFLMVHYVPATTPIWLLLKNPSGQTYLQALPVGSPFYSITEPWHRWDTAWYIKIAIQGYRANDPTVVFPPLYPLLIRLTVPFCAGNYVLASLLVSNAACLVLLILLFKLIELEGGSGGVAVTTLICLLAFPSAYYLTAGYSETLFLSLILGAFYSAFRHKWWLAGGLAALATLTRLQGAMLFIPLGWIAYVQFREAGIRPVLARLPAVLGGPLSALAYVVYLSASGFMSTEAAYLQEWQLTTRFPWESVQNFLSRLITNANAMPDWEKNNALVLLFIVITGIAVLVKLRMPYKLYVWLTLPLLLLRYHYGPQFEGMIRYVLVMFPCFIAVAMVFRRRWMLLPILIVGVYLQLVLLDRFVHWVWVA